MDRLTVRCPVRVRRGAAGAFGRARRAAAGFRDPARVRRAIAVAGVVLSMAAASGAGVLARGSGPPARSPVAAQWPAEASPAARLADPSSPQLRQSEQSPPSPVPAEAPSAADYATAAYSNAPPMAGTVARFAAVPRIDPLALLSNHHAPVTHHALGGAPAVAGMVPVAHRGGGRVLVDPASGAVHVAAGGGRADAHAAPMLRRALVASLVDRAFADSGRRDDPVPSAEERRRGSAGPAIDRTRENVGRAHRTAGTLRDMGWMAGGSRLGRALRSASHYLDFGAAVVNAGAPPPRVRPSPVRTTPTLGAAPDRSAPAEQLAADRRVAVDLADFAVAHLSGDSAAWRDRGCTFGDFRHAWNDPARRARVIAVADQAVATAIERRVPLRGRGSVSPSVLEHFEPVLAPAGPDGAAGTGRAALGSGFARRYGHLASAPLSVDGGPAASALPSRPVLPSAAPARVPDRARAR